MIMEVLSWMLERTTSNGVLKGWKIGHKGNEAITLTHLLFVDDTMFFCGPIVDQMVILCLMDTYVV